MEFADELYDEKFADEKRQACRGIVFKDQKLIMIYCEFFNDFSFPGGGVEKNESLEECLQRELKEEAGVVVTNIRLFETIIEKRKSYTQLNKNFVQINYYFLCDYVSEVENKYEDYEVALGCQIDYVDLDTALNHNQKVLEMLNKYRTKFLKKINYQFDVANLKEISAFGAPTAVARDIYILNLLKEKKNERI